MEMVFSRLFRNPSMGRRRAVMHVYTLVDEFDLADQEDQLEAEARALLAELAKGDEFTPLWRQWEPDVERVS